MKKTRENKETRKINTPFFKYIQPGQSLASKVHTRSMMELEPSVRYQQSARTSNHNKQNHHSSLCNHPETQDIQTVKSNSLNKLLCLFGGNGHNSSLMSSGSGNINREEKQTVGASGRQVFTCNIKNMNVNVSGSKEKGENKSLLVLKKGKLENPSLLKTKQEIHEETIIKLKRQIEEQKLSNAKANTRITQLETENCTLKKQILSFAEERSIFQQKFAIRQRQLQRNIQMLEKTTGKERCGEHELIIESLKKVINEQLRTIIELQKSKIERDQIQKLEDRINLNITMHPNHSQLKQQLQIITNYDPPQIRRKTAPIQIDENSFNDSAASSPMNTHQLYEDAIEEAAEEEENQSFNRLSETDSLLDQVDKYLTQWRSRA